LTRNGEVDAAARIQGSIAGPVMMRNTLPPLAFNEYCYGLGHARTFRGVDLLHDRIILPQTKNGDARIVYLNKFAQSALAALPSDEHTKPIDKLFPGLTPERVSVAFRRTCRALDIVNFRFHDLRHTAASWLRMSGADIHTVAQLLGHKDLRMASRYQHLSPSFLSEAVGKLDAVFGTVRYQDVTAPKLLSDDRV
jgi:integrase